MQPVQSTTTGVATARTAAADASVATTAAKKSSANAAAMAAAESAAGTIRTAPASGEPSNPAADPSPASSAVVRPLTSMHGGQDTPGALMRLSAGQDILDHVADGLHGAGGALGGDETREGTLGSHRADLLLENCTWTIGGHLYDLRAMAGQYAMEGGDDRFRFRYVWAPT